MVKNFKRSRFNAKQPDRQQFPILVAKGVTFSLVVSILMTILLALAHFLLDNSFIEHYLQYIIVAITIVSIFLGSAYSAHQSGSRAIPLGVAIGIVYVILSAAIAMEVNNETISVMVLANKVGAGIAVGALGGLVGVNL